MIIELVLLNVKMEPLQIIIPEGVSLNVWGYHLLISLSMGHRGYAFYNVQSATFLIIDNSTRSCVTDCPNNPNYFAHWETRTCVTLCPETATTKYYADN